MEEIPKPPEFNGVGADYAPAASEYGADRILHNAPPANPESSQNHSLEGLPLIRNAVELEQKSELEFERRHEVLDEEGQQQPSTKGMVPLGQVLADYPQPHTTNQPKAGQKSPKPPVKRSKATIFANPRYSQAISRGLLGGIVAAWILVTLILLTKR